ncbi:hypothetical protein HAX54_040991 [Datura stramonium]|uniref:Uncharacterized protein n=1 Tax=Datura stramonium TaxID=4076 RepID=A0ABS8VTJ9_DATST|nr:hypothetical protein [Datura stramonium]
MDKVKIVYVHLPRYYTSCKVQGHGNEECWYDRTEKVKKAREEIRWKDQKNKSKDKLNSENEPINTVFPRILASGRILGDLEGWKGDINIERNAREGGNQHRIINTKVWVAKTWGERVEEDEDGEIIKDDNELVKESHSGVYP